MEKVNGHLTLSLHIYHLSFTIFHFDIRISDTHSSARTGVFSTPHGSFSTPCFMPCGTKGAVKTLTPDELKSVGCEIMLANTFHLMLRPGGELVQAQGGLHQWIGWNGPMLTDSGGFQVFSLSRIRKIDDEGALFQSPIDGSSHLLTPEKSIQIQEQLGADIIMAFDECPPATADKNEAERAMERTHAWAARSLAAKKRHDQALFPIIQGGVYPDLRKKSAEFVASLNCPGNAIGGVAVGEGKEEMFSVVDLVAPLLPKDKPRYLMGVGEPTDIVQAVMLGVDMFDCVMPTRLARHGSFWTSTGRKSIDRQEYKNDSAPLEKNCLCYSCSHFSSSYLRHLMQEKEILGHRLLTIHNLHFLLHLLQLIRQAITEGNLIAFGKNFIAGFNDTRS